MCWVDHIKTSVLQFDFTIQWPYRIDIKQHSLIIIAVITMTIVIRIISTKWSEVVVVGGCGWRGYVWCNIPPASEHSDAGGASEHLEIGTKKWIILKPVLSIIKPILTFTYQEYYNSHIQPASEHSDARGAGEHLKMNIPKHWALKNQAEHLYVYQEYHKSHISPASDNSDALGAIEN